MKFIKIATVVLISTIATRTAFSQTITNCYNVAFGVQCRSTPTPTPKSGWEELNDTLAQIRRDREERKRQKEQAELAEQMAQQTAAAAAQQQQLEQEIYKIKLQGEQIAQQQQEQARARELLNQQVSQAILEHRCEDAKTIALTAGNLGLADQAMRLCTPLKVAPQNRRGGARKPASPAKLKALKQPTSSPNFTYPSASLLNQQPFVQAPKSPRPNYFDQFDPPQPSNRSRP
jgi:hypothetical protein